MSLFDTDEIANLINVTDSSAKAYLTELLSYIEADITQKGLSFLEVAPAESTRQVRVDREEVKLSAFNLKHVHDVTSVKVKHTGSASFENILTEDVDFYFEYGNLENSPINQIILIDHDIRFPNYLEITGKWYSGLYSDLPNKIRVAVIQACENIMIGYKNKAEFLKSDGSTTKSVSVGKIKIDKNQGAGGLIVSNIHKFDFEGLLKTQSAYNEAIMSYV